MKKIIPYIGIVVAIVALVFALQKADVIEIPVLGGVTNLDSLTLDDDLIVGGTFTQTGDAAFSGNVSADAGFIDGGVVNLGEIGSTSLTAVQQCDNELITLSPYTGDAETENDDIGVSLSFASDEAMGAECLGSIGDKIDFSIDSQSSISLHYVDLPTQDNINYASISSDITSDKLILVIVRNIAGFSNGASLQYYVDIIEASISYTD